MCTFIYYKTEGALTDHLLAKREGLACMIIVYIAKIIEGQAHEIRLERILCMLLKYLKSNKYVRRGQ